MTKQQHLVMKELPVDDRPYEKILRKGTTDLSDAELLAVIIRSGSRNDSALSLCQKLLTLDNKNLGFASLLDSSVEELMEVPGIGKVKAVQIKAALELGIRVSRMRKQPGQKISRPDDAFLLLEADMRNLAREELRMILLDIRNRIIRVCKLSEGGLSAAVIHPRDLFREAIKANAASIILAHNHPSGDPAPSEEDIATTRKIAEIGDMMGIKVVDHLILAAGGSLSLRQQGMM